MGKSLNNVNKILIKTGTPHAVYVFSAICILPSTTCSGNVATSS